MRQRDWAATLLLCSTVVVGTTTHAATHHRDPAARGLDVFLHMPSTVAPASTIPLQVQALGFPTVTQLAPLPGALIEAAWNPESLGPGLTQAPKPVSGTCDSAGRVHLDLPVPDGDERDLELLLSLRSGEHERTRTVKVRRERPHEVGLHVADTRVVPGSSISTWVVVKTKATGDPSANTPVELSLLEGGLPRHVVRLTTDAAGSAMGRVPIPRSDDPNWSWSLQARVPAGPDHDSGVASFELTPREETPGTPRILGRFDRSSLRAGEKTGFSIRVRDASDRTVAGLPIRYWIGPRGTRPPEDPDKWEEVSTAAVTDASGEFLGTVTAPTTIPPKDGTSVQVVVKCKVDGHDLAFDSSVHVGRPSAEATLQPEAGSIVPGLEQRVFVRITNDEYEPAKGSFRLTGDGLDATVTTDADGEAEFTWKAPKDVGAKRDNGPCAGGVAAAVMLQAVSGVPGLSRKTPFELCVGVDRDATAIVRPESPVVRAGGELRLQVHGGTRLPWSTVMRSGDGAQAASTWIDDGEKGGAVRIPDNAIGVWSVSASSPGTARASSVVGANVMVIPKVLPKLQARVVGGRAAPGGSVEVEAVLDDGHGKGLGGTVAALVIDLEGGGSVGGLFALDTRYDLCRNVGVAWDRCDAFLEEPSREALRRASLGSFTRSGLAPLTDPAATAETELREAFARVVKSVEGAVYQSTESADRLRDARRKGPNGWTFNPELWTLVTSTMSEPPITPGGEPLTLQDLAQVDPQVSFDNVARRVTHLKLFRILLAVREWTRQRNLDPSEPALKDPNAILRRLVKDGVFPDHMLLDPWGGTIQFVRGNRAIPFLSFRGHELRSPGPDGVIGTPDDPSDPFARVLRSGSTYAKAVHEDDVVDARLDMEVSDATINAWRSMFDSYWSDTIGDSFGAGGLGLSGTGEGGGGYGSGIGLGRIGTVGHGRGIGSISNGVAFWSPPRRTDAQGKVKFTVPLGDVETTWRVALVGIPDSGRPATTHVDVASSLPLSVRVDSGASWIEGDTVEVAVTLRNRTKSAIQTALQANATGAVALALPQQARQSITVPAEGTIATTVRVVAKRPGEAALEVRADSTQARADMLKQTWEVKPAGTPVLANDAVWVQGEQEIAITSPAAGTRSLSAPRLVLERGVDPLISAALDSLEPDRIPTPDGVAHAMDAASRVRTWAISRGGEKDSLAIRGEEFGRRAAGRLMVFAGKSDDPRAASWKQMASAYLTPRSASAPTKKKSSRDKQDPSCPPADLSTLDASIDQVELEPPAVAGAVQACWDKLVASAVEQARKSEDPVLMARLVMPLLERPHRVVIAVNLLDKLREKVALRPSGVVQLPAGQSERASRSMVYAALVRGAALGKHGGAQQDRLIAWLAVQRDTQGGYGSSAATRAVIRALLSVHTAPSEIAHVEVQSGDNSRTVDVAQGGVVSVDIPMGSKAVRLRNPGPGVIARVERRELRPWARTIQETASPVKLEVSWPDAPVLGGGQRVGVTLRNELGRNATVDVRIPLPPGATLAEHVRDVHQIQGVLYLRQTLDRSPLPVVTELPIRFGLSGAVTVPAAFARLAFDEAPQAVAPARGLIVGVRK